MKMRSSARAISRAYSNPNHLVFANYMLNHLYQIMIRRLRPLYLKTFGHMASHYGKEIRYTSKAYSYPYRLRFSKYVLKHLYQIIIRSYWGHLYYSLIDMPKKKKKFNYDTYICIKLIDQKIRFLRKKMDLGGSKSQLIIGQKSQNLSSTPRIPPYESRFPAQNAPIIPSITSIFLAHNNSEFDPKRCSKGSKKWCI